MANLDDKEYKDLLLKAQAYDHVKSIVGGETATKEVEKEIYYPIVEAKFYRPTVFEGDMFSIGVVIKVPLDMVIEEVNNGTVGILKVIN